MTGSAAVPISRPSKRNVLCIVSESIDKRLFLKELGFEEEFNFVFSTDIRGVLGVAKDKIRISGVIAEFKILIKASGQEKHYFANFLEPFPLLRIRVSPGVNSDRVPLLNDREEVLECFHRFRSFSERGIRQTRRINSVQRVRLCQGTEWNDGKAQALVTSDVGVGGCFVVDTSFLASESSFCRGDRCLLRFLREDPATGPVEIASQVVWRQSWSDNSAHFPGIGLKFIDYSDAALEFLAFLGLKVPKSQDAEDANMDTDESSPTQEEKKKDL